jgi:hypothetical protein
MDLVDYLGCFQIDIETPKFFFFPKSRFKNMWDIFILFLCLISVVLIPMEVGMYVLVYFEMDGTYHVYLYFETFISVCLFVDLIFNFFTAQFSSKGLVIVDLYSMWKAYIGKSFISDAIIIIPLDMILNGELNKVSYVFQVLIKIPRMMRMKKIFRKFSIFRNIVLKVLRMFFVYYLLCHYFACLLCYTDINIAAGYSITKESVQKFLFSKGDFRSVYAKYFTTSLLVLVGNNLPPDDYYQRIIYVIMFYCGTLCDSIIFGSMAIYFARSNSLEKNKLRRDEEINMLLEVLHMNVNSRNEIINYHEVVWWKDRDQFLNKNHLKNINNMLKTKIYLTKFESFFEISPYTENFSLDFLIKFTSKLRHNVVHPNDIITFEGTVEKKMFFIGKDGKFSVRVNGNILKILNEGNYFGEISFFLKSHRRIATVVSLNISTLYYIDEKSLGKLMYDFPYEAREFYETGFNRFKESLDFLDEDLKKKLFQHKIRGRERYSTSSIWVDDILVMLKTLKK